MKCVRCEGRGILTEIKYGKIYDVQCGWCNGTGEAKPAVPDLSGFPPKQEEIIICPHCEGNGYNFTGVSENGPFKRTICVPCMGSGRIQK